jgi:hypothetical protein
LGARKKADRAEGSGVLSEGVGAVIGARRSRAASRERHLFGINLIITANHIENPANTSYNRGVEAEKELSFID